MRRNTDRDVNVLPIRPANEKRCQPLFIVSLVLKLILVVLSSIILGLTAEYYESYMVAIIIGVSSCTLLYVAVSVMVEFFVIFLCPVANATCYVAEAVCSFIFLCVWLLCCGIATQVSLSAGSRITALFGWVGACTGLGTGVCLAIAVLYSLQVITSVRYSKV